MRTSSIILAAVMVCGSAQGTQSASVPAAAKPITVPYYPGLKDAGETRVRFAPGAADVTPGEIAVCANLAALRVVAARTAGADYANQNRVADLAFVLCLAGSSTEG